MINARELSLYGGYTLGPADTFRNAFLNVFYSPPQHQSFSVDFHGTVTHNGYILDLDEIISAQMAYNWDVPLFTSCALIYNDDTVKLISPSSFDYGINVPPMMNYDDCNGEEYAIEDLQASFTQKSDVLGHPLWSAIVTNLSAYLDHTWNGNRDHAIFTQRSKDTVEPILLRPGSFSIGNTSYDAVAHMVMRS